jgi:hypothetical protein
MRLGAFFATAALLLAPAEARHGKAGTWEVTAQADGVAVRAMMHLSRLSPAIQERLKARGVRMRPGGRVSAFYCMTPEEVEGDKPIVTHSSACDAVNLKRKGDSFAADVRCSGPLDGHGRVEITFSSRERYNGRQTVTWKFKGIEMTQAMSIDAKWLAPDCITSPQGPAQIP